MHIVQHHFTFPEGSATAQSGIKWNDTFQTAEQYCQLLSRFERSQRISSSNFSNHCDDRLGVRHSNTFASASLRGARGLEFDVWWETLCNILSDFSRRSLSNFGPSHNSLPSQCQTMLDISNLSTAIFLDPERVVWRCRARYGLTTEQAQSVEIAATTHLPQQLATRVEVQRDLCEVRDIFNIFMNTFLWSLVLPS